MALSVFLFKVPSLDLTSFMVGFSTCPLFLTTDSHTNTAPLSPVLLLLRLPLPECPALLPTLMSDCPLFSLSSHMVASPAPEISTAHLSCSDFKSTTSVVFKVWFLRQQKHITWELDGNANSQASD